MVDEKMTFSRTYITFSGVVRTLHQSMSKVLEVKQYSFDSARIFDCKEGNGRTETWGKGWMCVTVVQNTEAPTAPSGGMQGFMTIDITVDDSLVDSMFFKGTVVSSKTASSVAGTTIQSNGEQRSSLVTLLSDGGSLQFTRVVHCFRGHGHAAHPGSSAGPVGSGGSVAPGASPAAATSSSSSDQGEDRRRDRPDRQQQDDDRRKRPGSVDGSQSTTSSNGPSSSTGSSSSRVDRDPRISAKQKERRRQADDGSPRSSGDPIKRPKIFHDGGRPDKETDIGRILENSGNSSDAVAFLNYTNGIPGLSSSADGACCVECDDCCDEADDDDNVNGGRWPPRMRKSGDDGDTRDRSPTVGYRSVSCNGTREGHKKARRKTNNIVSGAGDTEALATAVDATSVKGSETDTIAAGRLSNIDVLPHSQENEPARRSLRDDDVLHFLSTFLDGTGKSISAPATNDRGPGSIEIPAANGVAPQSDERRHESVDVATSPLRPPRTPTISPNPCTRDFFFKCDAQDNTKPVCEIKPFISLEAVRRANQGSTRRGRGRGGRNVATVRSRRRGDAAGETSGTARRTTRSRGNNETLVAEAVAFLSQASNRRRDADADDGAERNSADDSDGQEPHGVRDRLSSHTEPATSSASFSSSSSTISRQPSLAEDGLEIVGDVEQNDLLDEIENQASRMSDEAASAAASLMDLDLF